MSVPTKVASKVRFSVAPLHFSSVTDKGDGMWELVFGANASAALAGSFSMHITTAEVTTQTSAPVTVDGAAPKDGQVFTFLLCDEQGNVLQEKTNDGQTVTFDKIVYSEDDLGADGSDASRHYTVKGTVDLPKTDDSPRALVAGAVLAGSAALAIAMATLRRRGTETSEKKRSRARS